MCAGGWVLAGRVGSPAAAIQDTLTTSGSLPPGIQCFCVVILGQRKLELSFLVALDGRRRVVASMGPGRSV